jgi:DNA processing protein
MIAAPSAEPTARDLPDVAWLVALASLPEVGPARLAALRAGRSAREAFDALVEGRLVVDAGFAAAVRRCDPTALVERWRFAAAGLDVDALWDAHLAAGIAVLAQGGAGWPDALTGDLDPPAVLFARGQPDVLAGPRVAVVGTRRCSRYGWDVAHRLGAELAEAGVAVVSGLALGIDGAAHRGALDAAAAAPVGVVGTGLDVVYPRAHRTLWDEVAAAGALLGEAPLGALAERWRFPARNRIIAGLADVVVVVESAEQGGAMHTVDEALRRDRPILAVPGPITSPTSAGTNRLLRDVAVPACGVDDVLLALGLSPAARRAAVEHRPRPEGPAAAVLGALGWTPATFDDLVERTGLGLGEVAAAVAALARDGWSAQDGPWIERLLRSVDITP